MTATASPAGWRLDGATGRRPSSTSSIAPGRIQLHARQDVLGHESFERLVGLDLGDIIGADGAVFATKRGELSLRLEGWTLLAKSLRPPPDKYHGLEDVELRQRHRELDLLANPETSELFRNRAAVVTAIRGWLDERGFLEVETPVLQPLYGGALARPFVTHHNALDRDLYLRIATELYLKRCIVGGSNASTSSARTSATRASPSSTTPSSRCSSGTRPTRTTTTPPSGSSSSSRTSPSRCSARRRSSATEWRSTSRRRGGA